MEEGNPVMFSIFIQLIVNGIAAGGIYALAASGLTLITGVLNLINFAHGELYMLGAYFALSAFVGMNFGFWSSLFASMIGVGLLAVSIERLVFKPLRYAPPINPLLASLGVSIFLQNASLLIWKARPQRLEGVFADSIIQLGDIRISMQRLLVVIVAVSLIILLQFIIKKTWLGFGIRAISQDLTASSLMGVNIEKIAPATFMLAGILAGAAGTLVGPIFILQPTMGALVGLKAFVLVIVGGAGNVAGATVAGVILGIVENLMDGFVSSKYKDVIAFLVLIFVLFVKREGLAGRDVS